MIPVRDVLDTIPPVVGSFVAHFQPDNFPQVRHSTRKRPQWKVERLSHDNKKRKILHSVSPYVVSTSASRGPEESLLWKWCVYDRRRCYQWWTTGRAMRLKKRHVRYQKTCPTASGTWRDARTIYLELESRAVTCPPAAFAFRFSMITPSLFFSSLRHDRHDR